jgi:iron(III) transport system ATP-binding protein
LSVAENVAFGLQVRKVGRGDVAVRVQQALEDVRLEHCSAERVDRLSGGQQQRVALARALVVRPGLLLLDEPLSSLDAALRIEARRLLRTIHRTSGASIIYVTHDQAEAMAMSDRIAVFRDGKVQQLGAPHEIYDRPATKFVANFVGRNNVLEVALDGVSAGGRPMIRFRNGTRLTIDPSADTGHVDLSQKTRLAVCVRPESFGIATDVGMFAGVVAGVEYTGPTHICEVNTPLGALHIDVPASSGRPSIGEHLCLSLNPSGIHLIQMEPGR